MQVMGSILEDNLMNTEDLSKESQQTSPYDLNDCILINYLDQDEMNLLFKHSQIASFKPKETLLLQGKKTNGIYLILKGQVLVTAKIMGQGMTHLEVLHQGHFLSAISFVEKGPCPTSFIAKDDVFCLFISNQYFEMLSVYHPQTKYKILHLITTQISERVKIVHDRAASLISGLDMASLSFFGRAIYSLQQPKKTTLSENKIKKESLLNQPIFSLFSSDEIDVLFERLTLFETPKNCKLVYEREKSAACFFIIFGAVQTCMIQDNKLAKLSVIGPDTLLASIGCIDNHSDFNITFITCEQTLLYKLSEDDLHYIKDNKPELWYKLFNLISYSLANLKKSIDKLDVRLHIETYNR